MSDVRDTANKSPRPETGDRDSLPQPSPIKLAIELIPLLLFGVTWALYGLKTATGILMVASVLSVIAAWFLLGHVTPMLATTTGVVLFFGALTFAYDDTRFFKMKPTAVNLLFALVLGIGLLTGRPLLKKLLGEALNLTVEGWRLLTIRWIAFFVFLAVANEIIWRTQSETFWVNFKLFGILPLTFAFMIAQIGLINRHTVAKSRIE
jgi:intracellular septation protein